MEVTPARGSSMNFSQDVLNPLVRGTNMERKDARDALAAILEGKVEGLLIGSFLTALTAKGETSEEMTGFVDAMIAAATPCVLDGDPIDIVGTGGDQLHTVNISTMASLAVAGAGVKVAKHGNRAASSSVGSADVLEALGVRLDAPADVVRQCLDEAGIGFMFAPAYHHGFGYLVPIRRGLGFRTIFNILGPLANPANVQRAVIGVAPQSSMNAMASVLQARGMKKAMLVSADDGLDELSLGSVTSITTIQGSQATSERVNAGDVLGRVHTVADIRGGDTEDNATVVRRFLEGRQDAIFDVACANAALGLLVADKVQNLEEGFDVASAAVLSGGAGEALERLVAVSNR
jgi:anthranilate phosphoribosyltransferase